MLNFTWMIFIIQNFDQTIDIIKFVFVKFLLNSTTLLKNDNLV